MDVFGTNPEILHRTDDPDTSVEAAHSVDTSKRERQVLEQIGSFDQTAGCISDQVRAQFYVDTPYSSVTARYSALDRKGLIKRGPDTRPGKSTKHQMVMRITPAGRAALT
jgi:hypothetical protein